MEETGLDWIVDTDVRNGMSTPQINVTVGCSVSLIRLVALVMWELKDISVPLVSAFTKIGIP